MNVKIWILAIVFGLGETAYFGWNVLPGSVAELICDGITLFLCALALIPPKRPNT